MASMDVIRAFARRRLYVNWFGCVTSSLTSCHQEEGDDLQKNISTSDSGSSKRLDDVHGCSMDKGKSERVISAQVEIGERGGGEGAETATMASQNHIPISHTPSGVEAGGGRDGESCNSHHCSSQIPLSSLSSRVCEESACIDELAKLTLSEDSIGEQGPAWNKDVTNLLQVLQQFGVNSVPVPYRPQKLRLASTEIFCKNLFLKDRRGQFFLVICDENQDMDLKWLRREVKAYRNFSFATQVEMAAILHVEPGGVTPFALMHPSARDVRVVMTTDLTFDRETWLNFHPLDQSLTLRVKLNHLEEFLQHYRVDVEFVDV